jgi:hypothetical protein
MDEPLSANIASVAFDERSIPLISHCDNLHSLPRAKSNSVSYELCNFCPNGTCGTHDHGDANDADDAETDAHEKPPVTVTLQ